MAGTVQNVLGAVPVRYKHDPPEGPKALRVQFVLGAAQQVAAQLINLSDWQMSQVVSAIVDNTLSDVDIQVTMGVTNTVVQVPAKAAAVVLAFSNGPSFNILIQARTSPAGGEQITITLLNFEKQPAIYSYSPIQVAGNLNANITNASIAVTGSVNANITNASIPVTGTVSVTGSSVTISSGSVNVSTSAPIDVSAATVTTINNIVNTTHNSGPLVTQIFQFNANGAFTVLGTLGNWILDSLDVAVEFAESVAAGLATAQCTFSCGGVNIHTLYAVCNAAGALLYIPGIGINAPSYRTWPQGLILPRGNNIICTVSNYGNYTLVGIRVNISGFNAP